MLAKSTLEQPRRGPFRRLARAFRRDQKGTAMVEFVLLAAPFFIFLLLIIEVAVVFLVGQSLETATQDSSRLVRTGQAATFSQQNFEDTVCDRLWALPNCGANLSLDVRVVPNFGSVGECPEPIVDGVLDDSKFGFDAGKGNDIVVVCAFYKWPVTPALPALLRWLSFKPKLPRTDDYLLNATAVLRNEPFS